MEDTYRIIISALIMAGVTYALRMLPITLFRKQIKSKYIRSFLDYTPYAVLGAITFPDILYATGNYISAVCGMAIALILGYFRKSLVVVAIAAIAAVFIAELVI